MNGALGQDVPTCLTEDQAGFLGGCIAQLPPPGMTPADHQSACNDYMWMADLPYCPGTSRLCTLLQQHHRYGCVSETLPGVVGIPGRP